VAEKREKQYVSDNAQLMAEWNFEKNKSYGSNPATLTCGSGKIVWWKCEHGHEWQATIANKSKGHGCPYCAGQKVIRGYNDLQTINPKLSKEWNYCKNNGLTPENVMANSIKKVWWKCNNGHEWQTKVANRNRGNGCPYCCGRYAIKGKSDLNTINPILSEEWNYDKNGELKPDNVTSNSNIKVWWKCAHGHEWKAAIKNRNQGRNCPYCSGKKILKGYNDLQTVNPVAAREWNYKKNNWRDISML
jgi:DNA-directed RNA polymerase subunit RPC12/RpoP